MPCGRVEYIIKKYDQLDNILYIYTYIKTPFKVTLTCLIIQREQSAVPQYHKFTIKMRKPNKNRMICNRVMSSPSLQTLDLHLYYCAQPQKQISSVIIAREPKEKSPRWGAIMSCHFLCERLRSRSPWRYQFVSPDSHPKWDLGSLVLEINKKLLTEWHTAGEDRERGEEEEGKGR